LGTFIYKTEFINNSDLIYAKQESVSNEFVGDILWKYLDNAKIHVQLSEIQGNVKYDMSNFMASLEGNITYFINRIDGYLYYANIE
jgi:hypothetical protein